MSQVRILSPRPGILANSVRFSAVWGPQNDGSPPGRKQGRSKSRRKVRFRVGRTSDAGPAFSMTCTKAAGPEPRCAGPESRRSGVRFPFGPGRLSGHCRCPWQRHGASEVGSCQFAARTPPDLPAFPGVGAGNTIRPLSGSPRSRRSGRPSSGSSGASRGETRYTWISISSRRFSRPPASARTSSRRS